MSQKCFEQIKRFLHISRPTSAGNHQPGDKRWWYKLESPASTLERAAGQYYQPGSNISIDATMIHCTKHTVKMPNKPIKQGSKIIALADRGSIWTFTWSSRLWGIVDLFRWPNMSPTGSMVLESIRKLPDLLLGRASGQSLSLSRIACISYVHFFQNQIYVAKIYPYAFSSPFNNVNTSCKNVSKFLIRFFSMGTQMKAFNNILFRIDTT